MKYVVDFRIDGIVKNENDEQQQAPGTVFRIAEFDGKAGRAVFNSALARLLGGIDNKKKFWNFVLKLRGAKYQPIFRRWFEK